ncbi:transporter [bacterium]|nr:transporter [bacterium]
MWYWRVLALVLLVFVASPVLATTNRFSLTKNSATLGHDGFFSTMGSQPLYQNEITFNSSFDYSSKPLQLNSSGSHYQGVVDHLLVQRLGVGYAPLDWLQIDIGMPLVLLNQFTQPASPTAQSNQTEVGDLTINGHLRLLPRDQYRVGVSLIPTITVPIGNENHFIADTSVHGGLLVSTDIDITEKLYTAFNFGFSFNEKVNFVDFVRDDQWLMNAGLSYRFTNDFEVISELNSTTALSSPFTSQRNTTLELSAGVRYTFKKSGITAHAGAGVPLVQTVGAPSYRIFAGISYTGSLSKTKQARNKSKVKERDLIDHSQDPREVGRSPLSEPIANAATP